MSIESDHRAALLAHAPLASLIGSRMAPDKVVEGTPRPFIVYTVQRTPEYFLNGDVAFTTYRIAHQVWADTRTSAEAVADALEAALQSSALQPEGLPVVSRDTISENDLDLEGNEIVAEFIVVA